MEETLSDLSIEESAAQASKLDRFKELPPEDQKQLQRILYEVASHCYPNAVDALLETGVPLDEQHKEVCTVIVLLLSCNWVYHVTSPDKKTRVSLLIRLYTSL